MDSRRVDGLAKEGEKFVDWVLHVVFDVGFHYGLASLGVLIRVGRKVLRFATDE